MIYKEYIDYREDAPEDPIAFISLKYDALTPSDLFIQV